MAKQILLIEDDQKHAGDLIAFIERHQYQITIAGTFEVAIQKIANPVIDIILANPFINSEMVSCLKSEKRKRPWIQILVFASRDKLDMAMDLLGPFATQYLESPFNSKALDLALIGANKNISLNRRMNRYSEKIVALHKEHDLLNQLFEEVPCYISIQNKDLKITAANKKFKKDFGGQMGGYCYEIYKHRTSQCLDCPVVKTFHDGKSHTTEEIVTSQFGKQYHVLTQTAPIRDEYGEISQVMETATDITQIRQLQDHLISLGLMLGSMSHGVKGMLTALDGGLYQLEMGLDKKDDDRILKAFGQISQMSEKIKKMVLEMLYYAKSRQIQYEEMDISDFAKNVLNTISPMAEAKGVDLDVSIPEALGKIEIDPNWMEAALVNFLENAVDACVRDPDKKKHWIRFDVKKESNDVLCFTIKDNGMGMDMETKNKMFTLFFTSKGSQGTGLGLFIAHKVIEYHRGTVAVESEKNKGSQFRICLPFKKPDSVKNRTLI